LPLSETLRAGLALRDAGYDVPKVSADIHAYVLNWLLALVAEHGATWREVATGELVRAIDKGRELGNHDHLAIKTRKIRALTAMKLVAADEARLSTIEEPWARVLEAADWRDLTDYVAGTFVYVAGYAYQSPVLSVAVARRVATSFRTGTSPPRTDRCR
jgi:hypothetical protein